jgi:predicted MFS family arabinose efflux permease
LFMWGIAAAIGVFVGGTLNDRFGSRPVILFSLLLLALAFASLSVSADLVSRVDALVPVLAAIIVWGLSAWSFFPAQQARLIGIAGLELAPVVLSLNASFMYLGFSLGAGMGSLALIKGSVADLGWVGALWVLASLILVLVTKSQRRA